MWWKIKLLFVVVFCNRNPSIDESVYDCLLESMGRIQSQDRKSAFCFFGNFNGHHSEWLGFSRTDVHGAATYDFASLSGCTQLVRGSSHRAGVILNLVISDVPNLYKVRVGCRIGRFDHSLLVGLDLSLGAPGFDFSYEVVLKSRVNWRAVCSAVAQMPWGVIVRCPLMFDVLDEELGRIIEVRVLSIKVRRHSGDELRFDELHRTTLWRK